MSYRQKMYCRKWQFKNIPEFKCGKMSRIFANCGCGMEDNSELSSYMHTFYCVDKNDVEGYTERLEKSGLKKIYSGSVENCYICQFDTEDGVFNVCFNAVTGTVRFILDRCRCDSVSDFEYNKYKETRQDTVFAQYSLHYSDMIRGTTCDCGMNYIIRLRDNSVIIIDGGEMEQSTDVAVSDYIDFLHCVTDTPKDEKIRISLWLSTHAHNDHADFFSKLLEFHRDKFVLERVAFNYPDPKNCKPSDSIYLLRERLEKYFPSAYYVKLHSGMSFDIANLKIDILISNEDTIGLKKSNPFPGMNSSSTIFTFEAEGFRTLFLADASDDNGNLLIKSYKNLEFDFLQAAHHGINRIYDVYEIVKSSSVLLPQCEKNMITRFSEIYEHLQNRYGKENIYLAHNQTDIFTLCNQKCTHSVRNHIGTAFDNSQW